MSSQKNFADENVNDCAPEEIARPALEGKGEGGGVGLGPPKIFTAEVNLPVKHWRIYTEGRTSLVNI